MYIFNIGTINDDNTATEKFIYFILLAFIAHPGHRLSSPSRQSDCKILPTRRLHFFSAALECASLSATGGNFVRFPIIYVYRGSD